MSSRNKTRFFITVSIFLIACSGTAIFQPTATPVPTLTPTSTITPIPTETSTPTISPTPDLLAYYLPILPSKPDGFEWKIVENIKVAVLIPEGWYFKEEKRTDLGLQGFYVTKENIEDTGRFSTGLTNYIFKDFTNHEEAEKYAIDLISSFINLETTKNVVDAWDYPTDKITAHHLRIEAEFSYETEINRYKTIHYITSAYENQVSLVILESPSSGWEEAFSIGGTIIDNLVLLID